MEKKMTKSTAFTLAKEIVEKSNHPMANEIVAKLAKEVELLAKKNSAEKKPTAQQTANDGIKTAILKGMEDGKLYTISDLLKAIPECADLTNQRVSALVRQLKDEGKVVRTEDKRKAYFSKA